MTSPPKRRRYTDTTAMNNANRKRFARRREQAAAALLRDAGYPVFEVGTKVVDLDYVRSRLESAMPETWGIVVVLDEIEEEVTRGATPTVTSA